METYRVQRLNEKPKSGWHAKVTQVFGGGAYQLKDEAWKVIQSIFDIDYMGAAEYEFGALPHCLQEIARGCEAGEYEAWSFRLSPKPGWWRERKMREARRDEIADAKGAGLPTPRANNKRITERLNLPPLETQEILVFSPKRYPHLEVETMIRKIADGQMHTKGGARLGDALDPEPGRRRSEHIGWLDLDHNLFWFIDKDVYQATVKLFIGGEA